MRRGALALLGLLLGASPFFEGFYSEQTWRLLGLIAVAIALALVVAGARVGTLRGRVAIGATIGVSLWALISSAWAESANAAVLESNRWALYAALLAVVVLALRDRDDALTLIAATTAGVMIVALYLVADMALGNGRDLFVPARISEPLGYANGQAGHLLLGFWPLVAAAERARSVIASGLAVAAATLITCVVALSQSRGAGLALLVTAAVILAAVPGRQRRAWIVVAVLAGLALAVPALADAIGTTDGGQLPPAAGEIQAVGRWIVVAAVTTGAVWALVAFGAGLLSRRSPVDRMRVSIASRAALVLVALAAIVALVAAAGNPFADVKRELDAFRNLEPAEQQDVRLVSGGGNRYDYWRVAVDEFGEHPLRGVGAGNYDVGYYRERSTTEDIQQPHSLELQTLAETGLVGGLLLLLLLGAIGAGFVARVRERPDAVPLFLAVGGGGTFLVWLTQTSVDWLHLIPGLTGIALCAAGVLLARLDTDPAPRRPQVRVAVAAAVALAAIVAAVAIGRPLAADRLREQGQDRLTSDPRAALEKARRSLGFDADAVRTYYLAAAAQARLGSYEGARGTLRKALEKEPSDFVTWGLLGDLAIRHGDVASAQRAYGRAARLNPRDPGLRRLATDKQLLKRLSNDPKARSDTGDLLQGQTEPGPGR